MRIAYCVVTLAVLGGTASASTSITGGNIIDQTWTAAGSPYVITGDVTIPAGTTLTIEAGTTLEFPGGDLEGAGLSSTLTELTVNGSLAVLGTPAMPVAMTGAASGSWYGIVVTATATSVVLNHVAVTNPMFGLTYDSPGSVIASAGLDVEGASAYGLYLTAGSAVFDGLTAATAADVNIFVTGSASLTLTNSIVRDGPEGGVYVTNTSAATTTLINCTLDRNLFFDLENHAPTFATVTVTSSIVTGSSFGLYGAMTVASSDIWNNSVNASGFTLGTGCLSVDPQYASATDYHLMATSPAIDSGGDTGPDHDFDDHPRPIGAAWDMGAYEYSSTVTPPNSDAGVDGAHDAGARDAGARDAGLGRDAGDGRSDAGDNGDPLGGDAGLAAATRGGGCCQAGNGGAGSAALLVVTGALLATRRRRATARITSILAK